MNRGDLGANADRLSDIVKTLPLDWRLWDVGVRAGVSSEILLSHGHSVVGVDTNVCPSQLVGHPRYRFIQSDATTALADNREPIGWAALDTLHIAEIVMCDLFFCWDKIPVGGGVSVHDTGWGPGKCDHYLDQDWERPEVGIERFFRHNPSVEIAHFPESWGMTFIRKLAYCDLRGGIDWAEVFRQRNRLLALITDPAVPKREIMPSAELLEQLGPK